MINCIFPCIGKLVDNSYNSHTDLRYPPGSGGGGLCSASGSTKEGILTKRMATLFNDGIKTTSSPNSIVLEPISDHHRSFENESGNNFLRNGKDSVDLQVNKPLPKGCFFLNVLYEETYFLD